MRASSFALVGSVVSLSLAALASPALAQSGPPGQCACAPPPGWQAQPQGWAPVVVATERWEQHRLGVGLRVGGIGLDHSDTGDEQQFGVGGLVARYRFSRHFEAELAIDHGNQQLEDGYVTDFQLTTVTASLLVHMRPNADWDWYLLGGLGGNDRRWKGDSDEAADARAHLAVGIGVERRFEHLVLGGELRALALGPREEEGVRTLEVRTDEAGQGAGQFSLYAGWYF